VAAVPGPIDSPQSAGSNLLLRDCATAIAGIDDALALMGIAPASTSRVGAEPQTAAERAILEALVAGPCDPDTLAARSGLPTRECLTALTTLELRGAVESDASGEVRASGVMMGRAPSR
jgi:DNA processing protein